MGKPTRGWPGDTLESDGGVAVVAAGTVPESAKKISDERKWD